MITIHPSVRISTFVDIEDSVRGTHIIIGEGSIIDSFVKIKPSGGMGDLIIGSRCIINSGCVFYTGNGIHMGDDVAVAANCTFAPTNHEYKNKNIIIKKQGFKPSKGGIIIGNDVWIGANCIILDGAIIGNGCVIAAGTIVRKTLQSYGVYGGNPITKLSSRQ